MIVAEGLTKAFGSVVAVDDVSFEVQAGEVVALLGHEGAGKTTLVRLLCAHVRSTSGTATILGKPYAELARPARRVGVLLGTGAHPARSARDHLRIAAARGELPASRVDDVLALVGLEDEAARPVRELDRGARGRLALATALLGEPEVVILDDPEAGLEDDEVRWLHELLRALADRGCAVLATGRELSDAAHVADRVLVLDRGALVAQTTPDELLRRAGSEVVVRSPDAAALADELHSVGIETSSAGGDRLRARDIPPRVVSELAATSGVPVWDVREERPDVDDALDELIADGGSQSGAGPAHDGERAAAAGAPDSDGAACSPDADLGALESELDDRLAALSAPHEPRVVAVLAPGTGLGATTLSFLIADVLAAAREGGTLAVALSCDHDRMSLPVAREERTSLNLADLLDDLPHFDEYARISPYVAPVPSGAHVICGSPQERLASITPSDVEALLAFAGRFYDTIVIDAGDVPEATLRAVAARADEVVLLGAPESVEGIGDGDSVLAAIESERADRATLVFNRVDEQRIRELDGDAAYALVPRDRELIRALDAGGFRLDTVGQPTRVALKRLALLVAERIA